MLPKAHLNGGLYLQTDVLSPQKSPSKQWQDAEPISTEDDGVSTIPATDEPVHVIIVLSSSNLCYVLFFQLE